MNTSFHGRSPRHLVRPALIAGMLAAAGSGCVLYEDEPAAAGCADIAVPALSITVLDADSQAPVAATVTVTDGAFVTELGPEESSGGKYQAAYERAGVYDIEVQSAGYAPARLEDVVVVEDACHVITEEIVVSLIQDDIACPPVLLPGLTIDVTDAETGDPVAATVRVTDGAYTEDALPTDLDGEYTAAWERAGVYDIAVSSEGYVSVTIEDVEVTAGPCHIVPKQVDVTLERE